jgi:hypothetical protein
MSSIGEPEMTTNATRFAVRNLSVLCYAQGFTLWHYRAERAAAEILAPGWWDPAAELLAPGDMVLVSSPAGGMLRMVVFTTPHVVMESLN